MNRMPDIEAERRLCAGLVACVSDLVMDPHRYFEQKWSAEIAVARSPEELRRQVARLVAWIAAAELTRAQMRRLDAALAARGLPAFAELRTRTEV